MSKAECASVADQECITVEERQCTTVPERVRKWINKKKLHLLAYQEKLLQIVYSGIFCSSAPSSRLQVYILCNVQFFVHIVYLYNVYGAQWNRSGISAGGS